jgi:hypothetical protein
MVLVLALVALVVHLIRAVAQAQLVALSLSTAHNIKARKRVFNSIAGF